MLKSYLYFEYLAAKLYFTDVKLHIFLDQADSGFTLTKGEWGTGLVNPADTLNFHTLWAKLAKSEKEFYLHLAKKSFYDDIEIRQR